MINVKLQRDFSMHSLMLVAFLTALLSFVPVLSGSDEIPANAHAKDYGDGWECDLGYRELGDTCIVIELPANAYLTDSLYRKGWECSRGYVRVDEACVVIDVPPNAYLNSYGDNWRCNRGYQKLRDACIAIELPESGAPDGFSVTAPHAAASP